MWAPETVAGVDDVRERYGLPENPRLHRLGPNHVYNRGMKGHRTRWGGLKKHSARIPSVDEGHKPALELVRNAIQDAPPKWKKDTVRTGLIGRKLGMTQVWDSWGVRTPVTVIEVRPSSNGTGCPWLMGALL